MKKIILMFAILSSLSAQAELRKFVCVADSEAVGKIQFSGRGTVDIRNDGSAAASVFLNYGADVDISEVKGVAQVIPAGQLMVQEVVSLRFEDAVSKKALSILLDGPRFSSTLFVNGVMYRSTCN